MGDPLQDILILLLCLEAWCVGLLLSAGIVRGAGAIYRYCRDAGRIRDKIA